MFRMAACRYAAMLIVEPMLREYTVDTIYQTTDLDTIYSLLAKRCERDPDDLIAQWQDDETRQWHDVSAGQMNDRVREVAKGLLGLGVKPGSMVVIYAATCYEWGVVDFACASIGAVSVPVYETDSPKQTGDIVAEVEPVIAFAGDDSHAQILEQIRAHSESLRYVFNFKANGLDAVADFGESVSDEELDKAIGRVRADDLFTIVYTSGSTGKPKGVMLSHRNFNHTVYNGYEVLNDMLYQPSRLLLFLPLAHCFARYIQYVAIGSHGVVGYISSFYMQTVGSSIRSALGPNMKWLACGGAPLNADLAHFFNGFDGITFIQGYGMTETAAPCLVNFQDANEVGSVGRPGCISIRLADDDELMIKGPNVFLGYYKQPQRTAEALTSDGWLHTGDLVTIDDRGFVFITGRKKDIIITAGGKNISPAPMEDVINTCPIVAHAVVIGDGRPFIAALIELDAEMTRSWLASQNLDIDAPMSEIATNDAVRALVQQYIDKANGNVSRAESVRKFVILDEEFNQEDGTLTPSMKVVRPKVLQRYADVIDNMIYAPKNAAKPLPATVKILDMTAETVKQSSESVKQAFDQAKGKIRFMKDDEAESGSPEQEDSVGDAASDGNDTSEEK